MELLRARGAGGGARRARRSRPRAGGVLAVKLKLALHLEAQHEPGGELVVRRREVRGDCRAQLRRAPEGRLGQAAARPSDTPASPRSSASTSAYWSGEVTTPTRAKFFAAARIMAGPPTSICSTISSSVARAAPRLLEGVEAHHHQVDRLDAGVVHVPGVALVAGSREDAAVHARVQGLRPPAHDLRVPCDLVDGDDVDPMSRSAAAVPPVDTIVVPRSASPRASSSRPVLSDTEMSARPTLLDLLGHHLDAATLDGVAPHPAGGEQAHHLGHEPVLHLADSLGERVHRVTVHHGHGLLQDRRAGVHLLLGEVHGDAGEPHAPPQRLLDRVHPRERREQGWVEVDDPVGEAVEELAGQDARPAGKDDEVGGGRGHDAGELAVALGALAAGHRHDLRRDPGRRRPLERHGVRARAHDLRDLDGPAGLVDRVDQRLQVAAAARHQHAHAERALRQRSRPRPGRRAPPPARRRSREPRRRRRPPPRTSRAPC